MKSKLKFVFQVLFLSLLGLIHVQGIAQEKKKIELEDIFISHYFYPETIGDINWMQNGRYYTTQSIDYNDNVQYIKQNDITTGKEVKTLFNSSKIKNYKAEEPFTFSDYKLSPDETMLLLANEKEFIYRRSTKAYYYLYDIQKKQLTKIHDGDKISYATFSPDGSKIAFVRNNDLFYVSLPDLEETQVTNTGKRNSIINGSADWVYEEEFYVSKAFFWSPDGNKLAFYTFDESRVKEYNMQVWTGLYPSDYRFKYPKAGEENAVVTISVHDLENNRTISMDTGNEPDMYIPRIYWTTNSDLLSIIRMNRLQNHLELLYADTGTGNSRIILEEKSDTYVDITFIDDLIYLNNNEGFIRTSEMDGYKHIYHYDMEGKLISQVTDGDWVVDQFYGIDEDNNKLYFTSTEVSPLERHLYVINLDGTNKQKLSEESGINEADFSPDYQYYINFHSSIDEPNTVKLYNASTGKEITVLEDNEKLKKRIESHQFGKKEFFTFTTSDDVELNGYLIKPHDFDPDKEYPVFMYVYGGPGSQTVLNTWGGTRNAFHHMLTQQGYIVASVDNRGTGGRGRAFKHATYGQLGKYETQDQIDAAKYLGGLSYVDESRIGIWGWSYGGYLSSLAVFMGADVFNAAIAVAPVSNWRFYDTIYTERYLKTPQMNPEGYDEYSPINHATKLDDYLLIHGTGDDNVHFQNTIELQNALIAANKQFETFIYPNRDHSISGGFTHYHLFTLINDFINRKL